MPTEQHGLVCFVDTQPSEQLDGPPEEVLCLVGVFVPDPRGLPGLKQYKEYRRPRARAQKAAELGEALATRGLLLDAWGTGAKMGCVERYGHRILSQLKGISISGDHYVLGGSRLHRKRALAAGWYAAALAQVAAGAAGCARDRGESRVTIFIDRFPGIPEPAMKFLRHAIGEGEVRDQWEVIRPRLTVETIYADTLEAYSSETGWRAGNDHPHAILADWLAHSLYAQQNPARLLDHRAGRSHAYKTALSRPWEAIESLGHQAYTLDEWMSLPSRS